MTLHGTNAVGATFAVAHHCVDSDAPPGGIGDRKGRPYGSGRRAC